MHYVNFDRDEVNSVTYGDPIAGTEHDSLYPTENRGNDLGYEFDVENGACDSSILLSTLHG